MTLFKESIFNYCYGKDYTVEYVLSKRFQNLGKLLKIETYY